MTEQREKAAAEPPLDCRVRRSDQDGFEASRFYFCGESPAQRIVFWEVWKAACDWQREQAANAKVSEGENER